VRFALSIAGLALLLLALLVAAIAITLSVTRTAGRRAVFIFYVSVVLYLFATWAIDNQIRVPVAPGSADFWWKGRARRYTRRP